MSPRRIGLVAASLVALAPALVGTLRAAAGGVATGSASASANPRTTHHVATAAGVQRRPPIRLTWPPPPLVNPIRLTITSAHDLQLDPTRDYILELPRHHSLVADYGCIHIEGGHNIVLIGGACYAPPRLDPTEGTGRVLYIEGNT